MHLDTNPNSLVPTKLVVVPPGHALHSPQLGLLCAPLAQRLSQSLLLRINPHHNWWAKQEKKEKNNN